MESLFAYIPEDRRLALLQGMDLPDQSTGAALFADISGFTPLTEALLHALGPQRGAEELSRCLNLIYDALIAEVNRYRGSVLIFSGDAITCWFDDQRLAKKRTGTASSHSLVPGVLRAATCAMAMQKTMARFSSVEIPHAKAVDLAIKISISAGPIRRFLVGDPTIQIIDIIAGKTLDHLIAGEHHANKGEVLVDELAVAILGQHIQIGEWRDDPDSRLRFAVLEKMNLAVKPDPWPAIQVEGSIEAQLRAWLLPPIYDRLIRGMGEFLTELRPTVALFLHFGGIDYDHDPEAQSKLSTYIRAVQRVLVRFDSYMLNLTIGDKGCYIFVSFGAPLAHEDDATRAVTAALELCALRMDFITDIKIGLSQGRTRTGAYGSQNRRTYGALGDDVNMAARLMQCADSGDVLVNQSVQKATGNFFVWEELPSLYVKGKSQAVMAFRLVAEQKYRAAHLFESKYALPMVGREAELALIEQKLDITLLGHGQVVGITAEVGMGKTRLLAEVTRSARKQFILSYSGECQSYGTNTSYLVWQNIWRGFFGVSPNWTHQEQIRALKAQLTEINPALVSRLPLLGAVLNLYIPDNELTSSFSTKLRKESLESLLVDCLQSRAKAMPFLLVLEDCQWLDPLSHDLLEVIGRVVVELPVMIAFAYRPPQLGQLLAPRVRQLSHFTEIVLANLRNEDMEQLISLKLGQVYGEKMENFSELSQRISERAEGNPFYIEELLNYLHDRGINPQQPGALEQIDLPSSLYSLVLSRIDQVSENQKILLKVASVIGRSFHVAMLWGIQNQFGDQERVRNELDELNKLELTVLDTSEPELTYLFKHVLTQEVAYETLPYAIRAVFHEHIGEYIENNYNAVLNQYVNLLAFHFDRSENLTKRRTYLLKAGEYAQANYANQDAVSYYQRLLPLLGDDARIDILMKLGQVLELEGEWPAAEKHYQQALALAEQFDQKQKRGQAQTAIADLFQKQSKYSDAAIWCMKAQRVFEQIHDQSGEARIITINGTLAARQGKYDEAEKLYRHALVLRRMLNQQKDIANILSNLSAVTQLQGDLPKARIIQEESLDIRRKIGDKGAIALSLNNLGFIALDQGELDEARTSLEEAVSIQREIGDKWYLANALNNLGNVMRDQGNYSNSYKIYQESLMLNRDLGDKLAIAYVLEDIGGLVALRGDQPERALKIVGGAAAIRELIGAPLSTTERTKLDTMLDPARKVLPEDALNAAFEFGRTQSVEQVVKLALTIT